MQKIRKNNITLLACIFTLSVLGLVMIFSASSYSANLQFNDSFYFVKKQFLGLILGVVLLVFFYNFNYHKFVKLRVGIIVVAIILLVLVFVPGIGVSANGARRWINIGINIQSSEIAKFAFVIFCSSYLSLNYNKMKTFKGILPILFTGGLICLLILLEPNLSVTLCVGMILLIMLTIGGISKKWFIILLIPAIALIPLLIVVEPYRLSRLTAFLNPWANPKDEGYQLIQSLYSLGTGGLFGVGLFNSRQKYLFLPFSESDFIFSIIGEELGFIGCVCVIIVYLIIIACGLKISLNSKDRLGSYLSFGIVSVLACQLFINIAVVTGSIPPTGIPLPFISAGGTSLSVLLGAMGIILNVSKLSNDSVYENNTNKKIFNFIKIKKIKKI